MTDDTLSESQLANQRRDAEAFGTVSLSPGSTESFFDGFLVQQGMRRNTVMRVVTDSDDGLSHFVQRSSPRPMESQLDWFHIGMKLELLRKAVVIPLTYQEYLEDPHAFDPVQSRVSRLRVALRRSLLPLRPRRGL